MKTKSPTAKPYFEDISEITKEIKKVLKGGRLILGPYTKKLEEMMSGKTRLHFRYDY